MVLRLGGRRRAERFANVPNYVYKDIDTSFKIVIEVYENLLYDHEQDVALSFIYDRHI